VGNEGLDVSPDGSRVAFSAKKSGRGPGIYEVSMEGGASRMLSKNGLSPAWSPDGASVVFSQISPTGESDIRKIDLINGKVTSVPDGHDKQPIFWSTPTS
jgi:Tol biopolymer transport system component